MRENRRTYADWGKSWSLTTSGKEDTLFSPYLEKPFDEARRTASFPPT